jgi:hypothetical protein
MQPNKSQVTLTSLLQQVKQEISYTINCNRIGCIKAFDPATQRADITLVDAIEIVNKDGVFEKLPSIELVNIPVQINATLKGGLTTPINEGDFCILQFNDRDLTNFLETAAKQDIPLASMRAHSFSDGIAVIGIFPNPAPITNYNNNATELFYEQTRLSLDEKAGLSNANGDLKTSIDNLIDKINGLINVLIAFEVIDPLNNKSSFTSPGTVASLNSSIADFTAVKAEFNNLLK